jgi:hypothetical protein
MPPKGGTMSESHKKSVRIGVLRKLYGDKWREVLAKRKRDVDLQKVYQVSATVEALEKSDPNEEYGNLHLYDGDPALRPMGKWEFMHILTARLRNPEISLWNFIELAKLLSEVKGWSGIRKRPFHRKGIPKGEPSTLPPATSEELQDLKARSDDKDISALILQVEEERRKGQQNG